MKITVDMSWMKNLPDKCDYCALKGMDATCVADKEGRLTDGWRPFWCPLIAEDDREEIPLFGSDKVVEVIENG